MIRAAMSIPANLVEGLVLKTTKDYLRFVKYSIGSATELEYHLKVAKDIRVITVKDFYRVDQNLTEVRKMLFGLSKALSKLKPD